MFFTKSLIFSAIIVLILSTSSYGNEQVKITSQIFSSFEKWSHPIEDYRTFAETWSEGERTVRDLYFKSIHDLVVFKDKMWFGYGDATHNLASMMMNYGYRGIELRYFASPDNPLPYTAFESGEEQIDHFRILNGELWLPGVDGNGSDDLSARPGIRGNVYSLDGDQWLKFRELNGGVHVHDIAVWHDVIYVVGSGTYDLQEWETGNIYRYLWGSTTKGKMFNTVQRVVHPVLGGVGDTRWTWLLPLGNVLYIFGYYTIFEQEKIFPAHAFYDGTDVVLFDEDNGNKIDVICQGTLPLPDGTGLMWGILCEDDESGMKWDNLKKAKRKALWHVNQDGKPTQLEAFNGENIVDLFMSVETDELLYLLRDETGNEETANYTAKILVAPLNKPNQIKTIMTYSSDTKQTSIAWWKGAIFIGMDNCQIYKSK